MSTNNINLTVELCAEDRARMDNILGTLTAIYQVVNTGTQPAPATEAKYVILHEGPAPTAEVKPAALPEVPEDTMEPAPSPVVDKPAVSLFDIQSMAQTMLAPGSTKRNEVRQIIKSYAPKLSDIPADKYAEVMEKLTALKGA